MRAICNCRDIARILHAVQHLGDGVGVHPIEDWAPLSTVALLPRHGGLGLHHGSLLCLVLLAWISVLPRTVIGVHPASVMLSEDARSMAQTDVTTTSHLSDAPSAAGESTLAPTPLQPDANERLDPTASKLSPRLRLLADWAMAGTMPLDEGEQARQLGLAESGGGSLSRDADGNPVVDVRVLDTSDETIAAFTALPADVLSVAPEYATVTLAVAPERLNDLACLAAVQYVSEVIQPTSGPARGLPGG